MRFESEAGLSTLCHSKGRCLLALTIGLETQLSLNDALAIANSDMMRWLVEEYGIEPIAAHLLIGHQAKYDVVALSGVMAVKIPKRVLTKAR